MKNRRIAILLSIMLLVTVGTVSCDTDKNITSKDTTNNESQDENADKNEINKENEIAKENNESPKENNVVEESLEDNKIDNGLPNINEVPTKEPPVEEDIPKVEDTTPEINDNNATVEDKAPTVQEKTPTIDNNTGIINNSTSEGATEYQFMAEVEQMIFKKVNEERAKAGVPALTYNTAMEKYARIKSKDMGDREYFSHNDPEGKLITDRMRSDGVSYNTWGENIAYIGGVSDPTALANQFMTNWMNSQGHRENILSTNFASIGVGVYKIGNKVYATQEFYR